MYFCKIKEEQQMETIANPIQTFTPVSLTANAVKEVKKLISEKELSEEFGLRVGVDGGGCSGMSYSASQAPCFESSKKDPLDCE